MTDKAFCEFRIELRVTGENLDPNSFTKALSVNPSEKWFKNGKTPSGYKRMFNCWIFATKQTKGRNIEPGLKEIYNLFYPKRKIIQKLVSQQKLDICLECIAEFSPDNEPSIYFDKKFINFLSAINAWVDIDLYGMEIDEG
jgi:hypothetical protein